MKLLEAKNVYSGYGQLEILHGVSVFLDNKELVTIIGPNGSGKSTLLKTIMGYLVPRKGELLYEGNDVTSLKPHEKVKIGISYVPQLGNVFPSLSVIENLEMGGYFLSKREVRKQIGRIFSLFPLLEKRQKQKAGTLSGGERQMVAMGSALMVSPKAILLDEPSAGMAPILVMSMFDKITQINSLGTAIIIVEQNARESLRISNRGYVLAMGKNEFEGDSENILNNPEIRKAYLGGAN